MSWLRHSQRCRGASDLGLTILKRVKFRSGPAVATAFGSQPLNLQEILPTRGRQKFPILSTKAHANQTQSSYASLDIGLFCLDRLRCYIQTRNIACISAQEAGARLQALPPALSGNRRLGKARPPRTFDRGDRVRCVWGECAYEFASIP